MKVLQPMANIYGVSTNMAGKGSKNNTSQKVSFGKRRTGKAKKFKGPKDKDVSKYRGQGKIG